MKEIYPVIHVTDNKKDFWKNIKICNEEKVNGIFLISHGFLDFEDLLELGLKVKNKYPNLWIGYNFLDIKNIFIFQKLIKRNIEVDGIWIDNSEIGINSFNLEKINKDREKYKNLFPKSKYFGGVAFKYCKQPKNLKSAIESSVKYLDIATTSGPGTGEEIEETKIKEIYKNRSTKIAVASGITIDNIEKLAPYIDIFLVSTGISDSHSLLNKEKTKELVKKVKEL